MLWFRSLKGFSLFLVLVGLALLSETYLTITLRELGGIFIIIGGIAYVLARGALGFTRRTLKLLALLAIVPTAAAQERIISKPDADMIFAFTRAEWEKYVRQVAPPEGWTLRLLPLDTGTGLARFNRSTGIGASVQPLFTDDQGRPGMIVVGNYYPLGFMRITDEVIKEIEQAARLDLGPVYSVSAVYAKYPETNLEGIDLIVMPATKASGEPRSFKCTQPLPEFTLGPTSNPSDVELAKLCACVWSKLPEGGWEREVSAKIRRGEDPGWRQRGFIPRFGAALDACGGRNL